MWPPDSVLGLKVVGKAHGDEFYVSYLSQISEPGASRTAAFQVTRRPSKATIASKAACRACAFFLGKNSFCGCLLASPSSTPVLSFRLICTPHSQRASSSYIEKLQLGNLRSQHNIAQLKSANLLAHSRSFCWNLCRAEKVNKKGQSHSYPSSPSSWLVRNKRVRHFRTRNKSVNRKGCFEPMLI